jgi:hypothetical protein
MKISVSSIETEEQMLAAIAATIQGGKWHCPLSPKTIDTMRAKGVSEERLRAIKPWPGIVEEM